jgi:hypothetical protein
MDVTLPSGATVQLRDKVTASDKFAVQKSVSLALDTTTGLQHSALGIVNDMRNEFLKLVIEKWTFDFPIPKDNMAGAACLGELDLDDYTALSDAVETQFNKLVGVTVPNRNAPPSR